MANSSENQECKLNSVACVLQLPPIPAGGPYGIIATAPPEQVSIWNVMFGDVWVCSGQSNCLLLECH